LTLGFAKLWFVFNLRDHDAKFWRNDITTNGWLWAAIGLCIVLLLAAVYAPGLSNVLQAVPPGPVGWLWLLLLSAAPVLIGLFAPRIRFHSSAEPEEK